MLKPTWVVFAAVLVFPLASAAAEQHREASFPMARGFDDSLTVLSGAMELSAPAVSQSAGFFRTTGFTVGGLSHACWQGEDASMVCVNGPLRLIVPAGASFGFNSGASYPVEIEADHALLTFVDLAQADGFDDKLRVGPSAIGSLVGGVVRMGEVPATSGHFVGFTALESGSSLELRDAVGILVKSIGLEDEPLLVEGSPDFPSSFGADVVVLPFGNGALLSFRPASDADAAIGLESTNLDRLSEILSNVRIIGASAKSAPFAILDKADVVLSEVFNGAFLRTRLSDDPTGLGDVAFAKFDELTVTDGAGRSLDFDGSYTLVVGDLGPSFDNSRVSDESQALRWWIGSFLVVAILVMGAWLWFRDGPIEQTEPGPHTWVARVATAVGAVVAFLVWDWQLNEVLGSSLLTSGGSGSGLGVVALVEFTSLLLAALLIGVPVFFAVRYGLALAKQPKFTSLAATAGVFFTVAFGILVLPALVSFLVAIVS